MAITLGAVSNSGSKEGVSSFTFTHTAPAGSKKVVVEVHVQDGTDANRVVTGITYGGVAMTKIRRDDHSGELSTELWQLADPETGSAKTVAVTLTGSCNRASGGCISIKADNALTLDAHNGTSGTGTNPSFTLTTGQAITWIIAAMENEANDPADVSSGSGWTEMYEIDQGVRSAYAQRQAFTSAGAKTVNWTAPNEEWVASAASFYEEATTGHEFNPGRRIGVTIGAP